MIILRKKAVFVRAASSGKFFNVKKFSGSVSCRNTAGMRLCSHSTSLLTLPVVLLSAPHPTSPQSGANSWRTRDKRGVGDAALNG